MREFRDHMEREYIRIKLDENGWNISRTAALLGIERTNLHKKMRALGLSRDSQGTPPARGGAGSAWPDPWDSRRWSPPRSARTPCGPG